MKSTIASLLGSAALVAAHGIVDNGLIGGPVHEPAPDRISRPIQGNGPVEDVTSIDLQCGGYTAGGVEGSKPAKLVAKAAAGEEVTLNWTLWPESHIGPTITYMAKCPSDDCTTWQPGTDAVWFKIQEEGREGTTNNWGATPLMKAGNSGYLVRHEIIALHAAYAYPGAQFYPGCHQIEVTGSGSTSPSDLVAFPAPTRAPTPVSPSTPTRLRSCRRGRGRLPRRDSRCHHHRRPVATPTQAADEDEDDCPAESEAPVATPTPTQAADEDEDDCPAETPSATAVAKRMALHERRLA
ncbi:cellulose-growth-specific protein [Colletotrichum tofieldiae]|nr:cellulose-growth-specific protein [Colletotrichum tofieldiae]